MAEAAVEEQPAQKFYCHICTVSFENASPNFTCPHCAGGFIEELLDTNSDNTDENDMLELDEEDPYLIMGGAHGPDDRRPTRPRYVADPARRRRYASVQPRHRSVRPRSLTRLASSNLRAHSFENLIHDFILNLGWGGATGGGGAMGPNVQLFLGNPGDYAWDREGLDAIITQLLNQMDGTGPPPLSKDVIATIPTVPVSQDQVNAKLQCSICWEDFKIDELVRKLPCLHVYHEGCICPWLELHGTCPICRQNLGPAVTEQQNNGGTTSGDNPSGENRTANSFDSINLAAQIIQAVQNSGGGGANRGGVNNSAVNSSSSSSTSTASGSASSDTSTSSSSSNSSSSGPPPMDTM